MDPSELDNVLRQSRDSDAASADQLPEDFTSQVLQAGRRQRVERITRRLLLGSTVAAALLAGVISFTFAYASANSDAQPTPPALSLFQSQGDLPLVSR